MGKRLLAFGRLTAVVCLASWTWSGVLGDAEDRSGFRIENKVFADNQKEPQAESTTIFFRGVVYDYLKKPAEVTVFDKSRGRFVLLDIGRRVQTEINTQKIMAFTEALRKLAVGHSDPFVQFLGDPKFEEQFDETAGELTLSSPWMTYRISTVAVESPTVAEQYREFSDWYARLNTLLRPGARPPFARLLVNAALQKRQLFPIETELTIRLKKGFPPKRKVIRSEHQFIRRLVESDRDRVAQTDQFMAIFKEVSFDEYQEKISK